MSYIGNAIPSATSLGGTLDVNGNKIISSSNGNIDIEPHGTGNVLLGNFTFNADQSVGSGQDDYVLTYDHSAGTIGLEAAAGGSSLAGNATGTINMNGYEINFGDTTGTSPSSAYLTFGSGKDLQIFHSTTNNINFIKNTNARDLKIIDDGSTEMIHCVRHGTVRLRYNGTNCLETVSGGGIKIGNAYTLPASDGSANQVLQTNGSGTLSFATVSGGGGGSTGNFTFSTNTMQTNDGDFNLKVDADDNLGGYANYYFRSGDSGAGYHRFWLGWNNGEVAHKWTNTSQYSVIWQRTSNFWFWLNEHGGDHPVNLSNLGSGNSADINIGTKTNGRVGISEEYGTPYYQFPRAAPTSAGQQLTADNTSGTLSWAAASSDIRLKKNIEDNSLGLDFINDLNTVKFNWKTFKELKETNPELSHYKPDSRDQTEDDLILPKPGMQLSLIAQELKEVLSKHDHEDFKGHTTDVHDVQEVNREEFIMPLIKAVQELSARVEELEKEK